MVAASKILFLKEFLKSNFLKGNSDISVIFSLAPIDFFKKFSLIFLVVVRTHVFLLEPGHFVHYVMTIWILLKPSVLARFLKPLLWQGKVQHSLITARWASLQPPVTQG